jgi:non-canonical purine NTP pyrophosphatase (RdgB/HAM1 family)
MTVCFRFSATETAEKCDATNSDCNFQPWQDTRLRRRCFATRSGDHARLLRELKSIPQERRTGRFICVLAAACNGKTLTSFRATAEGIILDAPRGTNGFGYDSLFYFPPIEKTFAELGAKEKSTYSHRGKAFVEFLRWCDASEK